MLKLLSLKFMVKCLLHANEFYMLKGTGAHVPIVSVELLQQY